MNKLTIKIATAVSSVAIVASSFVTPLLATTVEISGNGADSSNVAAVSQSNSTTVTQTNDANISNNINVGANTGGNDAKKNTGGDVSINTGDASATVGVSNTANSNSADVSGCCPAGVDVKISGNGADSKNGVSVDTSNDVTVDQDNTAKIKNNVDVDQTTGNNDANKNTGGDVAITTGDADATVTVDNNVNANWAAVTAGNNGGGALSVEISGNGADSENAALVSLATVKDINQNNYANIKNDVEVGANTGGNDAKKNTGGEVIIDTGDADATVDVSNTANFNAASLEGCGCIDDLLVKIAGNGAESENGATVELLSAALVDQDNTYDCGGRRSKPEIFELFGRSRGGHSSSCADVNVDQTTGNNDVKESTNYAGDPSVTTGDASADVTVDNTANQNVVGNVGDIDFPEIPSGNSSSLLLMLLAIFS